MSTVKLRPALERFRRRAGLAAGLSTALAAVSAAAVIAEGLRLYWFASAPGRFSTVLPAAVAAGVVASATAWLRRPSLRDVARTIDARLSLQAAIVTAYQYRDERDAFAERTVSRAAQALTASRPAEVYPWRLSGAALGLIGASAATALAMLVLSGWAPDASRIPGGIAGSSPAGVPGQTTPAAQPGASRATGRLSQETTAATAVARTAEGARTVPTSRGPSPDGASPQGDASQATPGVRPTPSQAAATGRATDASLTPGAGAGRPASLSPGGAPGQPGNGGAAPGGGRAGGSATTSLFNRRVGSSPDAAAAGQTSAAEEQALALDRVPISRRRYVQRYLQSLP